jgi:hypothetical protein
MTKDIHFYATKSDLLSIFDMVDSGLQYVRFGSCSVPNPETFLSGPDIPNLGIASSESAVACDMFLVCDKTSKVIPCKFSTLKGEERFGFDQLNNPHTIVFSPGGLWGNDVLLHGRVATVSDHEASIRLMKLFGSAIRKKFTKVRAFYVGPDALEMLKRGKRLTIAAQSPRRFDLAMN